jgi:hypothetical protein
MKVGDIVELIDESVYESRWAGRMTVIDVYSRDIIEGNYVRCIHPSMGVTDLEVDDLVVMEEAE